MELLSSFSHENVVGYLGFIHSDQHFNVVLEWGNYVLDSDFSRYVENGSLASMIKKYGAFPEEIVGVFMEQVLKGLSYLHQQKLVHHDIKGFFFWLKMFNMIKPPIYC